MCHVRGHKRKFCIAARRRASSWRTGYESKLMFVSTRCLIDIHQTLCLTPRNIRNVLTPEEEPDITGQATEISNSASWLTWVNAASFDALDLDTSARLYAVLLWTSFCPITISNPSSV